MHMTAAQNPNAADNKANAADNKTNEADPYSPWKVAFGVCAFVCLVFIVIFLYRRWAYNTQKPEESKQVDQQAWVEQAGLTMHLTKQLHECNGDKLYALEALADAQGALASLQSRYDQMERGMSDAILMSRRSQLQPKPQTRESENQNNTQGDLKNFNSWYGSVFKQPVSRER